MVRQVIILSCAQALVQTASVLVITVGGLAGGIVAASPHLATAPIAAMFLGTALATFPASAWMMRVGRRAGFVAGALLGTVAGLIAALGMWLESLVVLLLGTFLVGIYQGTAQFYRFAAAEVADEHFRTRAISLVLAGGVVAAILGPLLGRLGGSLFPPQFAGSFVLLAAASILAAGLLLALQIPAVATHVFPGPHRPLPPITLLPTY